MLKNTSPWRVFDVNDDLRAPIRVGRRKPLAIGQKEHNKTLFFARQFLGKRIVLRIELQVYSRISGKAMGFKKLHGEAIQISCPNPEQAWGVIRSVQKVCDSLDGSLLATISENERLVSPVADKIPAPREARDELAGRRDPEPISQPKPQSHALHWVISERDGYYCADCGVMF